MVEILRGIDLSIQNLLGQISVGGDSDNKLVVEISSPDRAIEPRDRGVSIFCYNINENVTSKNQESLVIKNDVYRPPLILDLYYLLTINSIKETEIPEIRQKIMRSFHDTPVLAGSLLADELRKNETDDGFLDYNYNTEIQVRLNQLSMEELNQLWALFPGIKYRPSLSYVISPVVVPSTQKMSTTLVTSQKIQFSEGV